ncbi:glutathione S-transferase family protein [Sphingobium sp. sgz301303]|uniref:glutathione S-transferase family protein n=1 Tax=Sphingobium sp. sgz301303 TaxID=3342380 RepID=UPI0035A7FFF8
MILCHSPRSCSTAALIALAESGLPYDVRNVDVPSGQAGHAAHLSVNPWGKVPALILDDGQVIVETAAILAFIATLAPDRQLLPAAGSVAWAQAVAFMATLTGTVHIAFRPLLRPDRLAQTLAGREDVTATGQGALNAVLQQLEQAVQGPASILAGGFSLCDAYAFVFAQWKRRPQVAPYVVETPRLDAVARAVAARPLASAVLRDLPAI